MSDTAIRVENLSKKYTIGAAQQRHDTLRDVIVDAGRGLLHKNGKQAEDTTLWALKDVSFEVKRGEVVGIIGRNGAGKSTLLKILSRITEPTGGRVILDGRVGSLLEVGTGFHPELTGRENIYLNGAILGMTRKEIERKFDEIVDFSEIEKFLDTPVKRYSSGMYVRLAFAVAAHLDPEILLVDEVLAVGDAEFQKRCLGKMGNIAKEGRTVLFVSHNMGVISSLCNQAILLSIGQLVQKGETNNIIEQYMKRNTDSKLVILSDRKDRRGNGRLRFVTLWMENEKGQRIDRIVSGEYVRFIVGFSITDERSPRDIIFSITVDSSLGQILLHCRSNYTGDSFTNLPLRGFVACEINSFPLVGGTYSVSLYAEAAGEPIDWVNEVMKLDVIDGDFYKSGQSIHKNVAPFLFQHKWMDCSR